MLEGMPLTIEASIGVAFWPENGKDVETLLQHADTAMYKAKEENVPHVFYDDAQDSYDPTRLRLVGELHRALERHELVLYYQPKVRLADGEVDSLEALVRWNHPRLGLVPPDDFIPLSEQTGLIKPLTLLRGRGGARAVPRVAARRARAADRRQPVDAHPARPRLPGSRRSGCSTAPGVDGSAARSSRSPSPR